MFGKTIRRVADTFFGVPKHNRWFAVRFFLVTYCGFTGLFFIFLFIAPFLPLPDDLIVTIFFGVWIVIGIRYIVQAVRMRKVLDPIGIILIAFFAFSIVYILGQGG